MATTLFPWRRGALRVSATARHALGTLRFESSASMESLDEFVAHATESMRAQEPPSFAQASHAYAHELELLHRRLAADQRAVTIHPSAIVHPNATLGAGVRVGPYSVVGPDVVLEDGVCLMAHVVVDGNTVVGRDTTIYPFACIGGEPQDKKHRMFLDKQDPPVQPSLSSSLVIGSNCVIREHVTIHGSTAYSPDRPTTVGDDCWILCGAHIGHDVHVGNRVVISNNVCVAGHVHIGDFAIIGGQVGLKQFVHIGSLAMIGGQSAVDGDVLPYGLVVGNRAKLVGLNLIGLRRARVSRTNIKLMLRVYRYLYGTSVACAKTGFAPPLDLPHHESIGDRAEEVRQYLGEQYITREASPMVFEMIDFVAAAPERYRSSLCPAAVVSHPKA